MEISTVYNRQLGIIHPERLQSKIAIIGAGSIGGWTALALSKLGCRNITVFDADTVEEHNAGSQIYKASDSGLKKVDALKQRLNFLVEAPIATVDRHWTAETNLSEFDIVIAAVDNITVRAQLFSHLLSYCPQVLFIDGRMAAYAIEIYTAKISDIQDVNMYRRTLFDEKDTLDIPCSERAVVFNVFMVAGLISDIVTHHANEEAFPKEMIVDLRNFTLFT